MIRELTELTQAIACHPPSPSCDFELNSGEAIKKTTQPKKAEVLVGIMQISNAPHILLTTRARHLAQHPGQIAFPGGKVEKSDKFPGAAALREAYEEIALPHNAVKICTTFAPHLTSTGYLATPILAELDPFEPIPNKTEVEDSFFVPLEYLLNPDNFRIERRQVAQGVWRRYYVVPYGPHYIWGATAWILRTLAMLKR